MTTCDLCGAPLDAMVLKRINGKKVIEKRCPNGHTRTIQGYTLPVSFLKLRKRLDRTR